MRDLVYTVYERRLRRQLVGRPVPRHVGVMCDGNRRWARASGMEDVTDGHRRGADKIEDLLRWSADAGVEVVTLWLLSTDNLSRPAAELEPLLQIISDLVEDLAGPQERWRIKVVGALDLLPPEMATVLKAASERTASRSTSRSGTAAGARSPTRSGHCCTSTPPPAPRSRSWPRCWTSTTSPSTSTPAASPTRTW
jgi:short-chain Z-isoprenyl diphosphate synthase